MDTYITLTAYGEHAETALAQALFGSTNWNYTEESPLRQATQINISPNVPGQQELYGSTDMGFCYK